MSLAKDYCKELLRELDQIAVYLPGRNVDVGDIITFPRDGLFTRPFGEFQLVTSLSTLQIDVQTRLDTQTDTYRYASSGGTSVSFTPKIHTGPVGSGILKVNFLKAGSLFLAAIDCRREEMSNVHALEEQLIPHRTALDWNSCYIVTSITRASRSIIMQSNSAIGQLELSGQTQLLDSTSNTPIEASMNFSIQSYKDSAFIQDRANQVAIFFTLVRYKRNILNDWHVGKRRFYDEQSNVTEPYSIISIDKAELLHEEIMLTG